MTTRIALFRGINVGKAKRIAMAELRALLEALGYRDVRTLLNSGNVVFRSPRASAADDAKRIAKGLSERTGITANTLVIDADTLDRIVAGNPFADIADDPSRLLVGLLLVTDTAPFEALQRDFPQEHFRLCADACYLWCADGILASRIGDRLAGAGFRDRVTTRNWSTVLKLQAMARG